MTTASDACTIARKDIQELRTNGTSQSGYLRLLTAVIIGGVYGWHASVDGGSSFLVIGIATFLACSAVIPGAADSFAGERERHTLETLLATRASARAIVLGKYLGGIAVAVAAGLLTMLGALFGGALHSSASIPAALQPGIIVGVIAGPALVGGLVAAAGMTVSMRSATVKDALQLLSFGLLAITLVPVLFARYGLFKDWLRFARWFHERGAAAVILAVVMALVLLNVLVLSTIVARFDRGRLIGA